MTTHDLLIDGQKVTVIRSPRRKKTISAKWVAGVVRLQIPASLDAEEEFQWAERMVTKLRRKRDSVEFSDAQLLNLAYELNEQYFGGEATPSGVEFSQRQNTLWGSCSIRSRRIRINADLAGMPRWVLTGVLIHELAHLVEPNHGPRFRALEARYERLAESRAFLAGVTYARHMNGLDQNSGQNPLVAGEEDDLFDD